MTFARYNFVVQDDEGNVIDGAAIAVKKAIPGKPLVALKANSAGSAGLNNPFIAASGAAAGFYVESGRYEITASWMSSTGLVTRTVPDVDIGNQGYAYTIVISPDQFYEPDDDGDWTPAFGRMASYINTNMLGGVTIQNTPGMVYDIWPEADGSPASQLMLLDSIHSLTWYWNGSRLETDNTFAANGQVVFALTHCSNINIYDAEYVESAWDGLHLSLGGAFWVIQEAASPWSNNINFYNLKQNGGIAGLFVGQSSATSGGYAHNINIFNATFDNV